MACSLVPKVGGAAAPPVPTSMVVEELWVHELPRETRFAHGDLL